MRPIKDGYGKHWEWEGNKPYWWCEDDDLCGPHPTRKSAMACYEKRHGRASAGQVGTPLAEPEQKDTRS